MSRTIDRVLQWLKWPAAATALLLLPGTGLALWELVKQLAVAPAPILPFLGGGLLYTILWRLVLRRKFMGRYFATFEHELTHAIFAWATLHKVKGIRSSWNSGGQMTLSGKGNWLITIAPYYFPTVCAALGLVFLFVPADKMALVNALMGAALAYHITSTRHETHAEQSDLKRVGHPFAWMFLPTANLLAIGMVIAFSYGGTEQVGAFLAEIGQSTARLFAPPSA